MITEVISLITIFFKWTIISQTRVTSTYTKLAHTFLSELEGVSGLYIGGEMILNKATKEEQVHRLIDIAWNEIFILHWSCLRLLVATSCLKYKRWKRGQKMIFVRILRCPSTVDFISPTAPFVPAQRPAPTLPLPIFPLNLPTQASRFHSWHSTPHFSCNSDKAHCISWRLQQCYYCSHSEFELLFPLDRKSRQWRCSSGHKWWNRILWSSTLWKQSNNIKILNEELKWSADDVD